MRLVTRTAASFEGSCQKLGRLDKNLAVVHLFSNSPRHHKKDFYDLYSFFEL